jgi:hypothetical protein
MPVDVVSATAGGRRGLKLLRSVFMKDSPPRPRSSHTAAAAAGHAEWLDEQVAAVIGRPLLERLLEGATGTPRGGRRDGGREASCSSWASSRGSSTERQAPRRLDSGRTPSALDGRRP